MSFSTGPIESEPPSSVSSAAWEPPRLSDPRFTVGTSDRRGDRRLLSLVAFKEGQELIPFGASAVHAAPSRMTVQVSDSEHIELDPLFLAWINHSCDPNVCFDPDRMAVVALRDIHAGEELVFFYPSTEWFMAVPFECHCGTSRCVGHVAGASQLPLDVLRGHWIAPHIQRRLPGLWVHPSKAASPDEAAGTHQHASR